MDKRYFIKILSKYLHGNATQQEEQFLFSYYQLFQDEPDVLALLNDEEKDQLNAQIDSAIWEKVEKHEELNKKHRYLVLWQPITAVAAIFIAAITITLFFLHNGRTTKYAITKTSRQDKANQLVHLADGSMVILTAGSKLTTPLTFNGSSTREVYLTGQAYFNIKHNPAKPFIVHTDKIQTRVLGTAFNIDAWSGSNNVVVTVTRGCVSVNNYHKMFGKLIINKQLIYDKKKENATQKTVNGDYYVAWEKQDLFCDNVTVEEAGELLEEKFNITILYGDELIKSKHFTTTLLKNENLEKVIKSICEFTNTVYSFNSQKTVLTISKINTNQPEL